MATTSEETSTITENQEGGIISEIISEIDEAIDGIIDGIVEEILTGEPASDAPINEEISAEETPVIDEPAVIEETPVVEELVIEGVPAIEEQPVVAPDANTGEQAPPADSGGGDSGTGDAVFSADGGASVDSGGSGESVSE